MSETVQHAAFQGGEEDSHGNVAESWAEPADVEILAFDPGSSSEPREPGHDRVVSEPTLYLEPNVVFGSRDRVTARGLLYEVDGETREWRHPDGAAHEGNVVTIRRVEG